MLRARRQNSVHPVRRLTAAVLWPVLATGTLTGGLVVASAAPAAADTATTTYVCTFPVIGEVAVPLTLEVIDVPATLPTGVPVPADAMTVEALLEVPDLAMGALVLAYGLNAVTGSTPGLTLALGEAEVLVDLASDPTQLTLDDVLDLPMAGSTRAFTPGAPGVVALTMPDSFDLGFAGASGLDPLAVPCALDPGESSQEPTAGSGADSEPAEVATVEVTKQQASMKGRVLTKPVPKGKRAQVYVTVWDQVNRGAPGQVIATLKGRQIGKGSLSSGTTRMRLAKLPVGKHRVTVHYQGTDTITQASQKVTIKVVKRR
jgi:hypothetical protein